MKRALAVLCLTVGLFSACGPTPAVAAPAPSFLAWLHHRDATAFTYTDSYRAIDQAFSMWGPHALWCAHTIASRESGHWWLSNRPGQHGMFQLSDGMAGSLRAAGITLHRIPDWFDPYVNAWTAMIVFHVNGNRFGSRWVTSPPGC